LADLPVDLQAGLVGQAQVEENNVRRPGADALEPFGAGTCHLDPITRGGERLARLFWDYDRVIIDEQHVGHGRLAPGGSGLIREAVAIAQAVDRSIQTRKKTRGHNLNSSACRLAFYSQLLCSARHRSGQLPFSRASAKMVAKFLRGATGLQRLALAERRRTMSRPKQVRLAGSVLDRSRHVCAFFHRKEEEYRALLPFIKEGFEQGDRAFHIVDPRHRPEHLRRLQEVGIDVAFAERTGQLEVRRWEDAYLRDGHFDQNRMLALIEEVLTGGKAQGFPLTRLVANMEWALEDRPGVDDIVEYETRLNYILPKYDDAVC